MSILMKDIYLNFLIESFDGHIRLRQTGRSYGAWVLTLHLPALQTVGLLTEPGESRETSGATNGALLRSFAILQIREIQISSVGA